MLLTEIKYLLHAERTKTEILKGAAQDQLPTIEHGWLVIEHEKILDFGEGTPPEKYHHHEQVSCKGKAVLPAWCDSHTHLIFASGRETEFVDKIHGLSYEEIAQRGGGILNSAKKLRGTSEDALFESANKRLSEIIKTGTGAVEIKSGYALDTEGELKMLRVAKRLKDSSPLTIKRTFLGAHALPLEYKNNRAGYIDKIVDEMLPMIADQDLADYCDVFCDRGFFTPEESDKILEAGWKYGLPPKIHANELDFSGGIQVGVKHKALSVDHLEFTGDEEIAILLKSDTMPTLLPGTAFFLNLHEPPARKMLSAGLPIALATDYNPGSCPTGNMPFILSLGCIKLKMTPNEVINAATVNGAYAMGLKDSHGTLCVGNDANLIITTALDEPASIPYYFGSTHVEKTMIKGEFV